MQAKQLCTANRAKKVVAGFTVLSLTTAAVTDIAWHVYDVYVIYLLFVILFDVVVPVAVRHQHGSTV